jgi:hypothetical protein
VLRQSCADARREAHEPRHEHCFQSDGANPLNLRPGPAYSYAARLAKAGAHPRPCILETAVGDNPMWIAAMHQALSKLDLLVSHRICSDVQRR